MHLLDALEVFLYLFIELLHGGEGAVKHFYLCIHPGIGNSFYFYFSLTVGDEGRTTIKMFVIFKFREKLEVLLSESLLQRGRPSHVVLWHHPSKPLSGFLESGCLWLHYI